MHKILKGILISVGLILLIIVYFIVYTHAFHTSSEDCKNINSLVRFCCDNRTEDCYDEANFNISHLEEAKDLCSNYIVLRGNPCDLDDGAYNGDAGWKFLPDGSVEEIDTNVNLHHQYCIRKNGTTPNYILDVCFPTEQENDVVDIVKALYPILMLFSVPFLVVTFLVYSCIKELRNLHGKCLMCYVLGLISLYLSLALIQLNYKELHQIQWLCQSSGYIAYISVLICFFWLNVMCYDIWSAFRQNCRINRNETKKFLSYCLYAFGLPLILTFLVYASNYADFIPDNYRSGIGEIRCWIRSGQIVELIYLYIPISIILILNSLFYSITAYKIYRVQKETSIVRGGESGRHSAMDIDKARFFLYLRLFVVMGITWIIEIVSWALTNSPILYITDTLNCLQGIIIFFLFIWKPKVKKIIKRKCFSNDWKSSIHLKGGSYSTEYSTSRVASSSKQNPATSVTKCIDDSQENSRN
ncbi:CLUMA_CG012624, isoform A [Clunio marinus]|uniref:CLUMA_CG012624, isoform A n=1 Tax=Clunio marinus TaxID=568069 RepID=A0A1J1IGW7_9DIPT|nr:CLUMA_CG012624, isoform A [Clunio marinus]